MADAWVAEGRDWKWIRRDLCDALLALDYEVNSRRSAENRIVGKIVPRMKHQHIAQK
jgi:hypothetical protein